MPGADELQRQIAAAMLTDTAPMSAALLVGGTYPTRRFAIHSRHYAASVARAIVDRFAATVWLVGSGPIVRAAAAFIREQPPTAPCMAEYGEAFPAFLASREDVALPPYVGQFATLDWQLGRIAITTTAAAITSLADCDPTAITDMRLALQEGLAYLPFAWPLDELMAFYLSGTAPDSYQLREQPVWLEVRGSRGELSIQRLACSEFAFRRALLHGSTLGDAAMAAADVDPTFSPLTAIPRLLGTGLVARIRATETEVARACGR